MATLADVPFLSGYLGSQDRRMAQDDQQLRQAAGAMSLADMLRKQGEEQQFRATMQATGGNPAAAIPALIQSGHVREAGVLADLLKGMQPKPAEPFTLAPGARRFDPTGREIASAPVAQQPFNLAPGATRYNADGTPLITAAPAPAAPSPIARLMAERDALPPGDPRRSTYDRMISTAQAGGGVNVTVSPTLQLGKEAGNKVDTGLLDTTKGVMSLATIEGQFKPEFQQFGTRLGAGWAALKDSAGVGLSATDAKNLTEFSAFKRNAINSMNEYIKSITGAAMSEAEAQRITKGMPNPGQGMFDGDSPTEFKSKLDDAMRQTKMALARYTYIKRNGVSLTDANGNATVPLDRMPQLMNERGRAIEAEYKKRLPNINEADLRARVRQTLATEFGLVQ